MLEATETVNLTLSVPPGSAGQLVSGRESAVLSIVDDDIGGTIQFSAATYSVGEGAADARHDRAHPHRGDWRWRDGLLRYQRRHRRGGYGLHADEWHGDLQCRANLGDVPGHRPRQCNARRRPHRQLGSVESGAESWVPFHSPHHEARDPSERGAEDRRQRPLAGVQCPDLLGEGERGAGHHHGRAGGRECHTGDRGLGHQRTERPRPAADYGTPATLANPTPPLPPAR